MEQAMKGYGTPWAATADNRCWHSMSRRSFAHDYSRPGIYHITIHVADNLGQPLGAVVGHDADSAAVVLTPVGEAIRRELLTAITAHYPMITVDAYVVMPEHLHFILIVRNNIVTKNGRSAHLGQVIAGFKTGCDRAFWAATGQSAPAAPAPKPLGTIMNAATGAPLVAAGFVGGNPQCAATGAPLVAAGFVGGNPQCATTGAPLVAAGFVGGNPQCATGAPQTAAAGKPRYATGRPVLFAPGYCDVQPIEPGQLETQRAYIRNNPRSRWQRSHDRDRLQPQRGGIDTALTPAALRRYLQHECHPTQATPEALAAIEARLLLNGGNAVARNGHENGGNAVAHNGHENGGNAVARNGHENGGSAATRNGHENSGNAVALPSPTIICDSYGDRALLQRQLLPVVHHRKDDARYSEQKARCLEEAARGAVLVSACISPKEREIIHESMNRGFATILIADNGFTDRYHPSTERIDACAAGRLLLVTPWQYQYRGKNEAVTVPFCKAMNCVAQALCRKKDSWWKQQRQQQ